jgi:hypothetical protein
MGITDFILARISEEELLADRALAGRGVGDSWASGSEADHYDTWTPWRVQSSCIATRLLVRAHLNVGPTLHHVNGADPELLASTCRSCRDDNGHPAAWPCYTVRVLAAEWSHHPDYRPEWRPGRMIGLQRSRGHR